MHELGNVFHIIDSFIDVVDDILFMLFAGVSLEVGEVSGVL